MNPLSSLPGRSVIGWGGIGGLLLAGAVLRRGRQSLQVNSPFGQPPPAAPSGVPAEDIEIRGVVEEEGCYRVNLRFTSHFHQMFTATGLDYWADPSNLGPARFPAVTS